MPDLILPVLICATEQAYLQFHSKGELLVSQTCNYGFRCLSL